MHARTDTHTCTHTRAHTHTHTHTTAPPPNTNSPALPTIDITGDEETPEIELTLDDWDKWMRTDDEEPIELS